MRSMSDRGTSEGRSGVTTASFANSTEWARLSEGLPHDAATQRTESRSTQYVMGLDISSTACGRGLRLRKR